MTFNRKLLAGAAIAGSLLATQAQAATLATGGGWALFNFGGSGSSIVPDTGGSSYDFLLQTSAILQVTDAFIIGDVFQIFDNGVELFITGAFDLGGVSTSDPTTAFAGTTYSHGFAVLGAGSHSITGVATSSPTGSGAAYIQLTEGGGAVPEPATWAMMIAGFGMVGCMARRRSTARVAV
jgi:hypothetical protein